MQLNHTKATRFSFESGNDNLGITPVENAFINLYMPQATAITSRFICTDLSFALAKAPSRWTTAPSPRSYT